MVQPLVGLGISFQRCPVHLVLCNERYKQLSVDCVAEVVWVTTVRYILRDCERVLVQTPVKGVGRV